MILGAPNIYLHSLPWSNIFSKIRAINQFQDKLITESWKNLIISPANSYIGEVNLNTNKTPVFLPEQRPMCRKQSCKS